MSEGLRFEGLYYFTHFVQGLIQVFGKNQFKEFATLTALGGGVLSYEEIHGLGRQQIFKRIKDHQTVQSFRIFAKTEPWLCDFAIKELLEHSVGIFFYGSA